MQKGKSEACTTTDYLNRKYNVLLIGNLMKNNKLFHLQGLKEVTPKHVFYCFIYGVVWCGVVLFRFIFFHFLLFRFILFRSIFFRFILIRFILFCFILFRVEPSNHRTKISQWLQEYESCLSAAIKLTLFYCTYVL